MSDEQKQSRRGGSRAATTGEAEAAPTLPAAAQVSANVLGDDTPPDAPPVTAPLEEGDSEGRTKVPLAWALENGERVLGIPSHELAAAFEGDEREELTLNAVRKTVDEFRAKVQNPDTVAEEG